ncbi:MAG: hypothetical protein Tsb0020_51690 [Haliangiales bacterium]
MRIYKPIVADNYERLHCVDGGDYDLFADFDGTPRRDSWTPVLVKRVGCDEPGDTLASDFPWFGSDVLMFRTNAVVALRDLLERHGELLPLATEDDVKLFAFNAWVVDALDEERSQLMRVSLTGNIMYIQKPVFFDDKIRGLDIFRLPYRGKPTYVSERFVERVHQAGLVGLEFNHVATIS